jgi:hypothetical protein
MLQPQKKVKEKGTIQEQIHTLQYNEENTERHYNELKVKVDEVSEDITAIKNAVIGNRMNGDSGMVQDIKKQKDQIYNLQVQCIKYDLYFRQLALVVGLLISGFVTLIIKMLIKI